MTKILDLGATPVLGRVNAVNRKHRLRTKHWADIEDWPESGASIDVLNADALDERDHYTNRDDVLVVSARLLKVLQSVTDVEAFPLRAGDHTVYLVLPLEDDDVMYEAESVAYSKGGYSVIRAERLRVEEEPSEAFCEIRNTGLLAISDELVDAAQAADVRWTLQDVVETYEPFRPHPYHVYRTGYACAVAGGFEAAGPWPEAPAVVPHPLGPDVRDENFDGDADAAWTQRVHKTEWADSCVFTRYCSGLALPELAARLDDDCAKSKLKKRWKETLAAGCLSMGGLPCVSEAVRDQLLAAGVEASFDPVTVRDEALELSTEFFLMTPDHVVDWIDWSKSDVGLLWSGVHDEYFDLEPTEPSYGATIPVVRVAGSNVVLVHESLAQQLPDSAGFYMTPLHECAIARNLDDCIRLT